MANHDDDMTDHSEPQANTPTPSDPDVDSAQTDVDESHDGADQMDTAGDHPHADPASDSASDPHSPADDGSQREVDSTGEPTEIHELQGVAAFFDHPNHLLAAATHARDSSYEEFDAYSPFPIHGMDEAMGLQRSWMPWVTFAAAMTGLVLANMLEFGTMTFDWPMIIGGKPFAPWPSFVPIMFELTVLVSGVTTAVVMLKAAGCFEKPMIIDPRITSDRFVLWISADDHRFDLAEVIEFLEDLRPLEVRKIVKDA